jgi:hypothetical protein
MTPPKKLTLTISFITLTFTSLFFLSHSIQATPNLQFFKTDIDFNQDSTIALDDAILALKQLAKFDRIQHTTIKKTSGKNQESKLEDVVSILQILSGTNVQQKTIAAVISIKDNSGDSQSHVPVSVICSFDQDDVPSDKTLYAISASSCLRSTDTEIPVQMNNITTYDDGAIKSAEISFILPSIDSNEVQNIVLLPSDQSNNDPSITLETVLNSGFHSSIKLVQNDKTLNASLLNLLQNHSIQEIFMGPVCSKWEISGPFITTDGTTQPVNVSFQIIAYKGCERIRVNACINNISTPIPGQYTFYYDLTMSVGEMTYVRKNMPLPPYTNWTKIMWWGQQPMIDIVDGGVDPYVKTDIVQTIMANTSDNAVSNIPVTFGHVFKKGDILPEHILSATLDDGSQIPVQLDKKAYYKNGSLLHGIISMLLPPIPENSSKTIMLLLNYSNIDETDTGISLSELIQSSYNTKVTIFIDGKKFQAQAKTLLQNSQPSTWLFGPIVTEWHVSAPFQSLDNENHPHLSAHFYIRAYAKSPWVKTSVIIENNWTYVDSPQNITYDITIATDSQTVYQQNEFVHYNHARWRKVFWQDVDTMTILDHQPIHIAHDINYLIATKAIPNFDPDLIGNIPESVLNKTYSDWMGNNAPMSAGLINKWSYGYEMWPVLKWTGQYLLSMDERAKQVMIGNAELSGSFPLHFRDTQTNLPVSIDDYPHCTTHWQDTINPETGLSESPAKCPDGADCDTPHLIDPERKPAYTFIPYLITGDYYFLEELHFWANYCFLHDIPSNRSYSKGIIKGDLGDMAYSIRTIGQAAFITPEDHPLKSYFITKLHNNINDYHLTYLENKQNSLGSATINHTKSIVLKDDYFTWALGYLLDLDYTSVHPLVSWKTTFPVLRMTSGKDFCWIFASNPYLLVADTATGIPYESMKDVYDQSKSAGLLDDGGFECNSQALADYLKENGKINYGKIGEMIGKPWASSQPAMIQAALAVAVDSGNVNAHGAWDRYMERSVVPDYASSGYPNYDILPRSYQTTPEDTDQDGIFDGLDECPDTPQNTTVNPVGCIHKDSDNDGIFDYYDACPDSPINVTINAIGCHDPDQENPVLDSDNDGVPDDMDQCPFTPSDTPVDFFGCPLPETGRVFEVGPDMPYETIIDCPTNDLMPGDEVRVYAKETPYVDKFLIIGKGTIDHPIKIMGIPDVSGQKPVLDGLNAISPSNYDTTNPDRQVIKIGQNDQVASYIIIDGFEIRNANNTNTFINSSGNDQAYHDNASGIRVENGSNITIRNCIVHHNGNGIQTGKETHNVLIESCQIYQNGLCGWENSYIHNMYLSGHNGNTITVQYSYIGELLSQGQQVKSRAEKLIFRYNWVEGGRNAQLDLVEDYEISNTIPYDAYVYGNIIIKPDPSDNSVMIHFGGDQSDTSRMGTLQFYNNTCIIKDTKTWGSRRIFKISSEKAYVIANNNIFYMATPTNYELLSGSSNLSGNHNWLSQSITTIKSLENSIVTESPNFVDPAIDNYHLQSDSPCKDAAQRDKFPENLAPVYQYQKDVDYVDRIVMGNAYDIGALEQGIPSSVDAVFWPNGLWPEDGLHVAESGMDSESCGADDTPCRTIKHTLTLVSGENRQTIYVHPGTYVENNIYIKSNTRLLGIEGSETTRIHTGASNGIFFLGEENTPIINAEISGFDIFGNLDDDSQGRQSGLIRLYHASNIAITHCLIHDAPFDGDCIKVSGYIENLLLDHLIVYNPAHRPDEKAAPFQENIDIFGSMPRRDGRPPVRNIIIRNSWLFHTENGGHWLLYGKIDVENMLIENNIFGPSAGIDDTKGAGYGPGGVGIGTHENEDQEGLTCVNRHSVVRNNIFMFIRGDAPLEIIDSDDVWVYNNLFYHNSGPLVRSAMMFMDHVYNVGKVNVFNNIFQSNQPRRDGIKASMFRNRNDGIPNPFFKNYNLYYDNIQSTEISFMNETSSVYPSTGPFQVSLPEPLIPQEVTLKDIDRIKQSFIIKHRVLIKHKGINPFQLSSYPNWMPSVTDTSIDTYTNSRGSGSHWDLGPFQFRGDNLTVETDKDKDGIIDSKDFCPDTVSGMIVDDMGCPVTTPEEHVFLSFDSESGDINDGFDNWAYRNPEKNPVYKMNEVGGFYSGPDSQGFHKAFFPYKNISRPRVLRYGYLDINTQIPVRGTGCLQFVFTGGAYLNNDIIEYSGLELFYKKQFDAYLASGQSPYATLPLFADEQFYVKFADSKTQPFDEAQWTDRLSVWIYLPKCTHENSAFPIRTIQYYPYINTSEDDHYYHWLTNIGMGGWTHLLIDAHPQRNNTGAPVDENGNPIPYEYYRAGGHDYPGNSEAYFNQTVAFAIRLQLGDFSFPTPVYLDHFTFYKSNQPENDETISNIGVGYNPHTHEFDIGFCDKYRGNGCHATYEVRYSFRPITNASYPKTKLCTVIQAPNLDFTYITDVKGQIKKPVTGYNQLWGLLTLEPEDEQNLKHGKKVYFAVKDVSNRTYPDRDPYDEELVEVENVGQVRRINLIKTIAYEIIDLPDLEP